MKKQILIIALSIVGGFFISQHAKAALISAPINLSTNDYVKTNGTRFLDSGGGNLNNNNIILTVGSGQITHTGYLSAVTLRLEKEVGATGLAQINASGCTTNAYSTNSVDISTLSSSSFNEFTFTFAATAVDIDNACGLQINLYSGSGGGGLGYPNGLNIDASNNLGTSNLHWGSSFDNSTVKAYLPFFKLWDEGGFNAYQIDFYGAYANGFNSSNFDDWQVIFTQPNTSFTVFQGINWHGTSTTTAGYFGLDTSSIQGSESSAVSVISKNSFLIPGNYSAYAFIGSATTTFATSSTINFTITATGTPVMIVGVPTTTTTSPVTLGLWNNDWCPDTNFAVLGADFGKGFCTLFSFLFVPGQSVVNSYTNLQNSMEVHAPFSYFYDVKNILENTEYRNIHKGIKILIF